MNDLDVKELLPNGSDVHLLTADQVATMLGRSVGQLADDRRAGRGPKWTQPFGPNGRIRYRLGDVREYLSGSTP